MNLKHDLMLAVPHYFRLLRVARLRTCFAILLPCLALPSAATLLWTESFEGAYPPAGWLESGTDPVTTYAMSGTHSVRLTAAADHLITPPLSGTSLIFWTYTTAADPLIVVDTAPGPEGPWSEAPGSPFSGYTGQWNGRFIDLPEHSEVVVRFRKSGTGTLYLDDIALEARDGPFNRPPVLSVPAPRSVYEGHPLYFSIQATDPDSDPITLTARDLPPGALFEWTESGPGEASGTFLWPSAHPPGVYTSLFTAADGSLSSTHPVVITVLETPPPEADWNLVYNLPYQSGSGTLHPAQFAIRDALIARLDALQAGDRAVLATFTFSANEGAGALLNAMGDALDRGAEVAFIADGIISLATVYGGTHSLFSLASRTNNPLTLSVDSSLSGIMHHKFGLFDYGGGNQWVFSASWNFTLAASANQWNIALETRSPSLFALFSAEAKELLAGRFQGAKSHVHDNQTFTLPGAWAAPRVRFAPYPDASPGGNNAERDIVHKIDAAQEEIVFALNKLNRFAIRDALIAAADRGVRVRGVIPASDTAPGAVSEAIAADLADPSRYTTTNRVVLLPPAATADYSAFDSGQSDLVHTKYMVIDPFGAAPVVIHGSPNWSAAALVSTTANDEHLLFLPHRGIAEAFYAHFERLTAAGPFAKGNSLVVRWDFNDGTAYASDGLPANRDRLLIRVPDPPALSFPSGALSANGWDGGNGTKFWETSFSTRQHRDLQLCSVQFSTLTGPSAFQLQYKTSASEPYRDLPNGLIQVDAGRRGQLIRLPLPPECNDQEELFLRWVMATDEAVNSRAVSAAGASRIDDVVIRGTTYDQPPRIDPIGNRQVFAGQPLQFDVTASDPIDHDPVTLSAEGLPPGARFEQDAFIWATAAPEGKWLVTFIASDKDGETRETITITVYPPPALLISEVADPAGTGANVYRFVELYNAGDKPIDLAAEGWVLSRQVNGGSTWQHTALSGQIEPSSTYVIAKGRDDFIQAYGFEPNQESSHIDGNGDDAYFLFRGGDRDSGMLVDIYGEFDTDGTGTDWDYTRSRATRHDDVLRPSTVWCATEWTIQRGAGIDAMNPGEHGPRPVFLVLPDPFVFSGGSLHLEITVDNPIRPDFITLSAASLPEGARFDPVTGNGPVSGSLIWPNPPDGSWSAELIATGQSGTSSLSLLITVAPWSRIDGWFHGWSGDTFFELENGQTWQQISGGSHSVSPPLFRPKVTLSHPFGQPRLRVESLSGSVAVEQRFVDHLRLSSSFTGLRFENRYTLDDGSTWEQISFERIPSSATSVSVRRWIRDEKTVLRFIDHDGRTIGTCTVRPYNEFDHGGIRATIDGWFHGWHPERIFVLNDATLWQQISRTHRAITLYQPTVTLHDPLHAGRWLLSIDGADLIDTVEVRPLDQGLLTTIDGVFNGFSPGRIFKLADGSWWRQSSKDRSTSQRQAPMVVIQDKHGTARLELPDEGIGADVEPILPYKTTRILSPFNGFRFGTLYETACGDSLLQLCFLRQQLVLEQPEAMLWIENDLLHMVARDPNSGWRGGCVVGDPHADDDGNGLSNLHEVIAGSDPLNPDSGFTLSISNDAIQWERIDHRIYTVEWTPCLSQPFEPIEKDIATPHDHWPVNGSPLPQGFFRLRVQLDRDI